MLVVFPALTVAERANSNYVTNDAAKCPETSLRQLNVVLVTYIEGVFSPFCEATVPCF